MLVWKYLIFEFKTDNAQTFKSGHLQLADKLFFTNGVR